MKLVRGNDPTEIFDKHFSMACPHCQKVSGITVISIPRFEFLQRFQPRNIGMVYKCDACSEPIFLRFKIDSYDFGNNIIYVSDEYEMIESALEEFEYELLPPDIRADFKEAAQCYSINCLNAFAAMCRRTVQSMAMELGTMGTTRVQKQIDDLQEMNIIDEETYKLLCQIIISGHDGAHPHLPSLSKERAKVLMVLMKDVLYQVFVRKAKLEKAVELRKSDTDATS